jgi:DNA repair exonuclease SbcCD ATPase subunit
MRLKSVSIAGFRGFSTQQDLDLDGDAVVVIGANGSGKTSLFDAILWALTGQIPRLGDDGNVVVGEYSPTGEARVELVLTRPDGSALTVVRRSDEGAGLAVDIDGDAALTGPSAEARLLEELWRDARIASDPWSALSRALTRGVYLQQDLLREFIEADSDQQRFAVIGEIIGAGRVGELQRQLESGKASWTRSTTALTKELEPVRKRRAALIQRLSRLTETAVDTTAVVDEWSAWATRATTFIALPEVAVDAPEAGRVLDLALRQLEALQLQTQRRAATAEQLLRHLVARPPEPAEDKEALRRALTDAQEAVTAARSRLQTAQAAAAAERSRQIARSEQREELRALAELALRHLGDRCPVCEQKYDTNETRKRLEAVVAAEHGSEHVAPDIDIEPIAAEVERSERAVIEATSRVRSAEQTDAARQAWQTTLRQLLDDLELKDEKDLRAQASDAQTSLAGSLDQLQTLRREGEALSLRLARATEIAQRAELDQALAALDLELQQGESELVRRVATAGLAGEILNALREASSEMVTGELERIEPLLQRIYATVDPHPSFRAVRFLTRTVRGRGRLWTSIDDSTADVSVEEPRTVLSSSQLNVLAVSVFLALNLGFEALPLAVVALDDPLQSLDDVNLLGLVDLLRRVKGQRQVIISTHDARFGGLLCRKLRSVSTEERSRLIRLESWTRDGPVVEQQEIPVDREPLRLVA